MVSMAQQEAMAMMDQEEVREALVALRIIVPLKVLEERKLAREFELVARVVMAVKVLPVAVHEEMLAAMVWRGVIMRVASAAQVLLSRVLVAMAQLVQ